MQVHYLHGIKISLYTTFLVEDPLPMVHLEVFYLMITFIVVIEVSCDNATYNWQCKKIFCGKYVLTYGIVWTYALFIIIVKLSQIDNWDYLNWKGYPSFSVDKKKSIFWSNTCFPTYCPIICVDITFGSKPLHTIPVLLQSPFAGSKFLKSII